MQQYFRDAVAATPLLLVLSLVWIAPARVGADPVAKSVAVESSAEPDPEALAWARNVLSGLTLRERAAQVVFPWIPGGTLSRNSAEYRRVRQWLEEDRVGGLVVSRGPAGEFAPMLNHLQGLSHLPLLIVSDLETGPSIRLTGGTTLPPAMGIGAAADEDLAYEAGRLTAVEARLAGIHLTLGPVLDVNSNPLNPIINIRSFGEDPENVARIGGAWIRGARSGGLLVAPKHFPGHGATEVDSHIGLPTLLHGAERLFELDIYPFARTASAGLDGVLVGHIAVPALTSSPAPASLAPAVVSGILRDSLGFSGLVFTDALNMGAITRNYTVPEASILALQAGVDVLLQPPGERSVIDALVAAVEGGRLSRDRLDEAVLRVLLAKAAAGLHSGLVPRAPGGPPPPEHRSIAERMTAASITLVRDRRRSVPLAPEVRRVLHIVYAADGSRFSAPTFNGILERSGRTVQAIRIDDRTSDRAYRSLVVESARADVVLVSSNLSPREFRGPLQLYGPLSRAVQEIVDRGIPVIAVSFGSPYVLDYLSEVDGLLLAWSTSAEGQRAAARALLGEVPITGTLPVSLPPHHLRGEGLLRP